MNDEHPSPCGSALTGPVRPYATSVTWRNDQGGSWQQWHDDDDPMPTEWDDRPPDEVVHVYTAAQVSEMLAAERERCAKVCDARARTANEDRRHEAETLASLIRGA